MTRRSWAVLVSALVVGCSLFDTSGVGSGGASVGEGTETSGVETTSSADEDTSSTTTDSSVDTTSASTSGDTTTTTSGTSTTTGAMEDAAYPDCIGESCADASQSCLEVFTREETVGHVCTQDCRVPEDCPLPETGRALPQCVVGLCRLDCSERESCPAGMQCVSVVDEFVCVYPL